MEQIWHTVWPSVDAAGAASSPPDRLHRAVEPQEWIHSLLLLGPPRGFPQTPNLVDKLGWRQVSAPSWPQLVTTATSLRCSRGARADLHIS